MGLGLLRPTLRRRSLRLLALLITAWTLFEAQYLSLCSMRPPSDVTPIDASTRIYVAALHWNNEAILRSHWNQAVIELTRALGPAHLYIAVLEGGSWDHSADALRDLDRQLGELGVDRSFTFDNRTHHDEISAVPGVGDDQSGWVMSPQGLQLRRIPYLAKLRNRILEPLGALAQKGAKFDRVLFLNDVIFTVDDVVRLLQTNGGHYAAACSLDFSKPPEYYDTFALRDSNGHEHATQTWPYFRSFRSRQAMKYGRPVPVLSCWNGMVAMPADVFLPSDGDDGEAHVISFRAIDDSLATYHLEGSECCLIHADNPLSASHGIYLNPHVRVGYKEPAYRAANPATGPWLSFVDVLAGLWKNRVRRWLSTPVFKELRTHRLIQKWAENAPGRSEPGEFCLVNEMQVLVWNGWAHI